MNLLFVLSLFLVVGVNAAVTAEQSPAVRFYELEGKAVIENGYVRVTVDREAGAISELAGDFTGKSDFETNVLARPFTLSATYANSSHTAACSLKKRLTLLPFSILSRSEDKVEVEFQEIGDCDDDGIAIENWLISLRRSERFVQIRITGRTNPSKINEEVISLGHILYTPAPSLYGLFERGALQMMNNLGKCLGSDQSLERLYALGNGQSVDLQYTSDFSTRTDHWEAENVINRPPEIVLYSQFGESASHGQSFGSAFQDVLIGSYPHKTMDMASAWSAKCWEEAKSVSVGSVSWDYTMTLGPNNMDFPVFPIPFASADNLRPDMALRNLIPDMPELDIRTFLTGIYASPVGCLQSYFELRDGTIAPTISHPDVGYSPDTNFFDPDNFISVSAMMYSGDPYLINEVRKVIERTAETMCGIGKEADPSYCDSAVSSRLHPRLASTLAVTHPSLALKNSGVKPRTGQLMHHFINLEPTYESIATSEQLGPNIFWTLSAIRYASITNDPEWLRKMLPFFELSTRFLASFYDEDQGLLLVPGPLWIDVLVRENYTSDSNAIAPYTFRQLAEVFESLNVLSEFSVELRRLSDRITSSMNNLLWDDNSNDHYITQLDADLKTTRDFVDYDANLLAVAFDVAPDNRVNNLLGRVDSGDYTHVRGTWCCEVPYSGDAEDCYIVGGDVCGDSIVTLGRIGWADSHARKRVGDLNTFNNLLLAPLQQDMIEDTWLYERYDANGTQIRTSYYFEYPSLVTMMLSEIRYGIDISLSKVVVNPFPVTSFTYSFGSLAVLYSESAVEIHLQTQTSTNLTKTFFIHGLQPHAIYNLHSNVCTAADESLKTDANGLVTFKYPIRSDCPVILTSNA